MNLKIIVQYQIKKLDMSHNLKLKKKITNQCMQTSYKYILI